MGISVIENAIGNNIFVDAINLETAIEKVYGKGHKITISRCGGREGDGHYYFWVDGFVGMKNASSPKKIAEYFQRKQVRDDFRNRS